MTEQPRVAGAQTLARGLAALRFVVDAPDGLTVQELATALGVHRSIAYRIVQTLVDCRVAVRGEDGRYRGGSGLLHYTAGAYSALRERAMPVMRRLATELEATVSLIVAESGEAVAIAVVSPTTAQYRLVFAEGSAHPLDRGSAGLALRTLEPPRDDDPEDVRVAREQGWAHTFGEVEPSAHGLAIPLRTDGRVRACLNLITHRADIADRALGPMLPAAEEIAAGLR